jgi:RNA polymerase sigma factor (sigma-70 family)
VRLALFMASKRRDRLVEAEDRTSAALLGLVDAVRGFDPERGQRLATYAPYAIRRSMIRASDNEARMVRVPTNVLQAIARSDAHSADHHDVRRALPLIDGPAAGAVARFVGDDVERIGATPSELATRLHDVAQDGPCCDTASARALLDRAFAGLRDPRLRVVLELRVVHERTLAETGRALGLSRQRIMTLQQRAVDRMRDHLKHQLTGPHQPTPADDRAASAGTAMVGADGCAGALDEGGEGRVLYRALAEGWTRERLRGALGLPGCDGAVDEALRQRARLERIDRMTWRNALGERRRHSRQQRGDVARIEHALRDCTRDDDLVSLAQTLELPLALLGRVLGWCDQHSHNAAVRAGLRRLLAPPPPRDGRDRPSRPTRDS